MKGESELRAAITDAMAIFEDGVSKDYQGEKVARLVAALEVFTDNFSEAEQDKLFQIAAIRLQEIRAKP